MSGCGAAASRTPSTFGGSWCEKSQFPQPSSGSTSASRRAVSYAMSARLPQQPDRRRWFEGGQGGLRQAGHHSDPSRIGGATCQRCVHGCQVRQPQTCLADHLHTAGSCGTAQIAIRPHDDDELASPSTPAPADSAPTARSAGLSHLHSPRALSSLEIRAIN